MDREGKLTGRRKDYPIEIYIPSEIILWDKKKENIIKRYGKGDLLIEGDDELIDLISDTYLELKEISKDGKVEIKQAFNKLSIWEGEEIEPMQIVDRRTSDILKTYEFFKSSPQSAFNPIPQIWFDAVTILNKLQPRLF